MSQMSKHTKTFRTDINGLRAYAVLAVVLFHFKVPGFGGGFVGVDVFFVISGFLMTGIILRGLESNGKPGFGLFQFYMARAKRIIPALFVLCLVLLVAGWFLLAPDDYNQLAREVDRALLFISNIYYYKKSGYFDADTAERLLLHTWSLSVEWQFYMLFPLALMLIAKASHRLILPAMVMTLLISLVWSVNVSYINPTYAFYLLPSRTWEMLLGGLAYFISRHQSSEYLRGKLYYPGLAAIFLAIALYDSETIWPGLPALLPTLGTFAVILANQEKLPTSNALFQRLGDWSYSIYLWHWPFAVALVLTGNAHFGVAAVVMIALSVLLGWLSYRVIENPLRIYLSKRGNLRTLVVMLVVIAPVFWAASMLRSNKGFPERLPDDIQAIFQAERDVYSEPGKCHLKREKGGEDCIYGTGPVGVILMGDSHAMSLMNIFSGIYEQYGKSVMDWSLSGCPTVEGLKTHDNKKLSCPVFNDKNFNRLNDVPGVPIVLVNRFSAHFYGGNEDDYPGRPGVYMDKPVDRFDEQYAQSLYQGYKQSLCKLTKNNPVYMMRPTPELKMHVPKSMGRSRLYKNEELRVSISVEEFHERNALANQLIDELVSECGVVDLDPAPLFCDQKRCYGDLDGNPIYFDDDHLNNRGAALLLPLIRQGIGAELP